MDQEGDGREGERGEWEQELRVRLLLRSNAASGVSLASRRPSAKTEESSNSNRVCLQVVLFSVVCFACCPLATRSVQRKVVGASRGFASIAFLRLSCVGCFVGTARGTSAAQWWRVFHVFFDVRAAADQRAQF